MRVERLIVLLLLVVYVSSTYGQHAGVAVGPRLPEHPIGVYKPSAGAKKNALEFDIIQRTCALYVALRSGALESPVSFGRDLDDVPVHWNMCPGGNMVACADVPAANGDTTQVGIPWPY